MKPLNGKSAMTREERNARRRELDKDPFHRALTNKKQRERNAKNREKRLARRRAWYAAHREEECERQRRWSSEHRESKRRSWKKWADKHRDYLHERDARRSQTPEGKLRVKRQIAERRRRRNEDPAYAEHVRAVKRAWYHKVKNRKSGLRWMLIQVWIPRWKRLQAEGGEKTYLKRACKRTRYYYALWKCDKFDILKTILSQTGKGK